MIQVLQVILRVHKVWNGTTPGEYWLVREKLYLQLGAIPDITVFAPGLLKVK